MREDGVPAFNLNDNITPLRLSVDMSNDQGQNEDDESLNCTQFGTTTKLDTKRYSNHYSKIKYLN